jgi:DNA modification methylase
LKIDYDGYGTIYNGDCLEVMKEIEDKSVDLTVTSPPYDNLRTYNGYSFDFENTAKELFRITKDGGVVVWVVGDQTINGSETGTSFKQALYFKEIGFNLHDTMIYAKNNFSNPSTNRYHQIFEYMFVLSKGNPKVFNPIKDKTNVYAGHIGSWGENTTRQVDGSMKKRPKKLINDYGLRYNIWKYKTSKNGQEDDIAYKHPAIFPIKLAKDHIISWSNEGDVIFDPFLGSGTTVVASVELNRKFIGRKNRRKNK